MPELNKDAPVGARPADDNRDVMPKAPEEDVATDAVVDETGARLDVPNAKTVTQAHYGEPTIGATGPTNWWRIGLVVMALLILGIILMQWLGGGTVAPTGVEAQ